MTNEINTYKNVSVLTGTSGSGKSTAASILENLGAHIVSADFLARKVVERGSRGLKTLISAFGDSILAIDGSLDRNELHRILVSDSLSRKQIEEILHPLIQEESIKAFDTLILQKKFPIVYDCPLYFEKNLARFGYKQSILVVATQDVIIDRIVKRDKISVEDALKRIDLQMPQAEKIKLADIVIENNGSIENLESELKTIFPRL